MMRISTTLPFFQPMFNRYYSPDVWWKKGEYTFVTSRYFKKNWQDHNECSSFLNNFIIREKTVISATTIFQSQVILSLYTKEVSLLCSKSLLIHNKYPTPKSRTYLSFFPEYLGEYGVIITKKLTGDYYDQKKSDVTKHYYGYCILAFHSFTR